MTTKYEGGISQEIKPTITFVEDSLPRKRRLDLNKATVEELNELPGIGPVTAKRILEVGRQRPFVHLQDLQVSDLVSAEAFATLRKFIVVGRGEEPYIHGVTSKPDHIMYRKPFSLLVGFEDSTSGTRLVRLQADSVSHSIDIIREVSQAERQAGTITLDLQAMEDGVLNVQVSLYDNAGHKDYFASTLPIFHNPPTVRFTPSGRSLRLVNGAAQHNSDGSFSCNANWSITNGTDKTTRVSRVMSWRITDQSGGLIESSTFAIGSSDFTLGPFSSISGWFNFGFPPGNATFNRLQNREFVRIRYQFTEIGTGATLSQTLSWRTLLGPHVNIIRVGEEGFSTTERTRIFNALRNNASSIYQLQDLDIGTIRTFIITNTQAGGYTVINDDDEAEDLTGDWTVPNDAVDMFVVRSYVGSVAGLSPVDGPCDKDAKGMNGSVIELQSGQAILGVIMAHELGHYLGLSHTNSANNVMQPNASTSNTVLTSSQATNMRDHCFIRFLA